MNTITAYKQSIEIAKWYIICAKEALNKLEKDEYARYGCKEVASAKRTSMDLTRILAEVRRPFK